MSGNCSHCGGALPNPSIITCQNCNRNVCGPCIVQVSQIINNSNEVFIDVNEIRLKQCRNQKQGT